MKSNLDKSFKSDESLEKDGIWFEIQDGVRFRVRRFGGSNFEVKKSMAKFYKPYAKLIEKGLMPDKKERAIYTKAFVHACIVDWEGIEIDGKIQGYTPELAVNLLSELPELLETLVEHSSSIEHYREDLGN